MMLDIELLTDETQFMALQPEWNALLQNSPANNIFLTWEWVSTWWQSFGADYHLWIVTAREKENGRLLGIAPLVWRQYVQSQRLPMRELRFLGSNQAAPDHLDFIVYEDDDTQIDLALAQFVWSNRKQWDAIYFDSIKPSSVAISELCRLSDTRWQKIEALPCPRMGVPESWDDFQKKLGKNLRSNLRRYDRHLSDKGDRRYVQLDQETDVVDAIC